MLVVVLATGRSSSVLKGVVEAMNTNLWDRNPNPRAEHEDARRFHEIPQATEATWILDALAPQVGSVKPPRCGLPRRTIDVPRGRVSIWWLGVHGGAGETTLAQLLEGSWETGHAWPHTHSQATELPQVILVARTNARGLHAAQLAATDWASGNVAVRLRGLVLIADAPGRLPRPLRDFAQIVAGGVPRVWQLPWVEAWRLGEPVCTQTAPKAVTAVIDELRALQLSAPAPTPTP